MNLILYPNPLLNQRSEEVKQEDLEAVKTLIAPMTELMRKYSGVGLAAVQAGMLKRFAVLDMSKDLYHDKSTPAVLTLINPEIIKSEAPTRVNEGCLSLPWYQEVLERPSSITVTYRDESWEERTREFTGLMAQCIQHEVEHMNGQLLNDNDSVMKTQMYRKKLKKKGLL